LPAVIGRGHEVAVSLDGDMGVSRRHAEIYSPGAGLHIRDLNSTHGTYVNGYKVSDQPLQPGDKIAIGQSILQVQPQ
jgi:pSer/pThr/pTyr-binding forkhead associated (FHA) protein